MFAPQSNAVPPSSPPFSWLTWLWAIYLDPQCKIFLCTISSYYSRINQDHFHVKCQQRSERESFIAEAVQRFLCSGTGTNRALPADHRAPGLFRGTSGSHSSDAFPNPSVSRTVPEAGEDAGNCHLNDQLPGKSHRDRQRGYLNSQHMGFRPPKSGNCPPGMESC